MKMNVFSSAEFDTLKGGQDVAEGFKTEGVFWVKLQNMTPYFMQLTDDNGHMVALVAPCCIATVKLTEDVAQLTVASRADLVTYTPTGMTQAQWGVYLELDRTQPVEENYKFL